MLRAVLVVFAVLAVFGTTSVIGALRTPGNANFKAKWADWLRAHHASFVVNHLEHWYYTAQAPAPGGRPAGLNVVPQTTPPPVTVPNIVPNIVPEPITPGLSPPVAVPLVVFPALPAEGHWQPTGPLVGGRPGMYIAQYRADTVYTGQITTAVWIDPHRLRVRLVPGAQEPGGTWPDPPFLAGPAADHAVAAFNGGFRFQDARGGFYLDGRSAIPLRKGAASIVIANDGRVDIGTWGAEVDMAPSVRAVLQNLALLVDRGQIDPSATHGDNAKWGFTLGANTVVARSGIGVTATGALLYVAGPSLTIQTLAEALQRAGAVRAMTLDLNPEWVTFNLYAHNNPADPAQITATKLYPQMNRPATRFLGPTKESRDFFTVSTE